MTGAPYRIAVVRLGNICRSPALGPAGRVRMFGEFDPVPGRDVPDPYFGGDNGFEELLTMVERTADALVERLRPAGHTGRTTDLTSARAHRQDDPDD